MSWITVIWSTAAGACVTLAAVHFLVWLGERKAWESLFFALATLSVAAMATLEAQALRAPTPLQFGLLLRWMHVPAGIVVISMAWFTCHYLRAGRTWLAWLVTGLRGLVLAVNFSWFPNATFREISGLREVTLLGERLSVPVGTPNPFRPLIHLSSVLVLVLVLDAAIASWKRGGRRRPLTLGGAITLAIILSAVCSQLMTRGLLPGPLVTVAFLPIVFAMGLELSAGLIHEKQLARESLDLQERMQLAVQAADLGLWEWDVVRDEVWATEASRRRVGVGDANPIDLPRVLLSVHPDDRESLQRTLRRALDDGGDLEVEYRLVPVAGEARWVVARGKVERDAKGDPLRVRGISLDITERKRAEVSFRESEARFRATFEQAAVGMAHVALEGRFLRVNQKFCDMVGYSEAEMLGRKFQDVIHPEELEADGQQTGRLLRGEIETYTTEGRFIPKDGDVIWGSLTGSFVRNQEGHPDWFVVVVQDITQRKKAEAELRQQSWELSHAQRVSAMGQLSAALAHELNQPLGAILRNAEAAELFLQQDPPDLEELRAILVDIRQDEQRATAVIQRMRSLLKRRELRLEALAVDELIGQVANLLRAEFQARGVTLQIDLPPGLPRISGDRVHLQQVVLNLLLNSLDAMEGLTEQQRQVVLRGSAAGDGMVELAVIDRGAGIPPARLPHLFEPFFTSKSKGSGIGLSVSKTIVEMHGGRIWAENNRDGGATFRFTLRATPIASEP